MSDPNVTAPVNSILGGRQQFALVIGGMAFMIASISCFFALIFFLIFINHREALVRVDSLSIFIDFHFTELILFASAIVSAILGYGLLSAAGAAGREVIPRQDYKLLSMLVAEEKEKGIELYVRLNSLSGPTGFFTKIGITGLPLATIALTLIFSFLGISNTAVPKLFDFANLTLGAFLGSYVQRQVSAASPKPGRTPEA